MADIADTTAPKSDQLDAVDLLEGPRTFTIKRVEVKAGAEQPVNVYFAEFPRPWRPGISMRRILLAVWGGQSQQYVGRRVRLWCDPDVKFGGQNVGGTRIIALSHMDKRRLVPLLITRGKTAMYSVEPLTEEPPTPRVDDQSARLFALIRESGIGKDEALALFSGWINREITATKEMSLDELAVVIEQLAAMTAAEITGQITGDKPATEADVTASDPYDGPMFPAGDPS